jgi:hypothetical protein
VQYGDAQLQWALGALDGAAKQAGVAPEAADPDMALAILRLAGQKLQAGALGRPRPCPSS